MIRFQPRNLNLWLCHCLAKASSVFWNQNSPLVSCQRNRVVSKSHPLPKSPKATLRRWPLRLWFSWVFPPKQSKFPESASSHGTNLTTCKLQKNQPCEGIISANSCWKTCQYSWPALASSFRKRRTFFSSLPVFGHAGFECIFAVQPLYLQVHLENKVKCFSEQNWLEAMKRCTQFGFTLQVATCKAKKKQPCSLPLCII